MKYDIVNRYRDACVLNSPVVNKPFDREKLVSLFQQAHSQNKVISKCTFNAVRILTAFFNDKSISQAIPDEKLLEQVREYLILKKKYRNTSINEIIDVVRKMLNAFFFPQKLILRKILIRKVFFKYQRFLSLSPLTQKLIIIFESDARCLFVKRHLVESSGGRQLKSKVFVERKAKGLSDYNRKSYIGKALAALSALNMNAIEDLNVKDLENLLTQYRSKGMEDTARGYLEALHSMIGNGVALGLLQRNPFDGLILEKRQHKARKDFIMPDQIEKLLDLKDFDMKNAVNIRNHLITLFFYDTGLRAATLANLEKDAITETADGRFRIAIKGELLKGDKTDKVLYVLFQSTIPLMRQWLNYARAKFCPQTRCLFVSEAGNRLSKVGIANIVKKYCMKLGIKTVGGKWPSPHILRHTLATLNIEPFGKCLSARVMQQRLIHVDLSTLENNYVHNNPLGEMEHYRILLARGERNDCFHRVSKDDFFMILDSLPSLSHSVVKEIKTAFAKELSKQEQVPEGMSDFISESLAIEILGEFKVDYRSLRVWALKEHMASIKTVDGKMTYVYDKSKLENLKKDYMSVEMAAKKFKGSRTNFYLRLKSCQKNRIGRTSLILKDDFLSHILDGCQPVHIGSTKELNGRMVA